jgi:hypothetical protein
MRDCGLPNDELWNSNISDYLYSKMKNLLVTKGTNKDCSILKYVLDSL